MLSNTARESFKRFKYAKIEGFYEKEDLEKLNTEYEAMIAKYYNKEQLGSHAVYPSDKSDARESHAMMISEGASHFPKVEHDEFPTIKKYLKSQNQILAELTNTKVPAHCRSLINYQRYECESKPVGEHFDGEYMKAQKAGDNVEFKLLEGILPRYVGVLVVKNENNGRGVELLDKEHKHLYQPELNAGDLIIFDNIHLRHRVPKMTKPRISIGLRNFDHMPLHFAANKSFFKDGAKYQEIPEGFVSYEVNCDAVFDDYMKNEWPKLRDEYTSYV